MSLRKKFAFVFITVSLMAALLLVVRGDFLGLMVLIVVQLLGAALMVDYLVLLDRVDEKNRKILQADKMAALGEMSGGMAHEINNPLTIIKGNVIQAKRVLRDLQFDQILPRLEKIDETCDRIAKIVNGILLFSRDSAGDPLAPVSLNHLIESTISFCEEKFRQKEIFLRIDPIPDVQITCRASQISQVILNLLCNSYDAVVDLPERWVELRFEKAEKWIDVFVVDSGKGIQAPIANRMMEAFFTTKEVGRGTGLGLSISSGIMHSHRGQLFYEPQGVNTTFVIRLPYQVAESPKNLAA